MNPTPKEQPLCPAQVPISVFVGIDWADAKHDICLLLPDEGDARHLQIENTPEALHDWLLKLIEEFGARGHILRGHRESAWSLALHPHAIPAWLFPAH